MSKPFYVFVAVAVALVATPALRAQDASALVAGVRVRLVTPALETNQQTGKVVSATSDTIVFRSDANPITRSIPIAEIKSIEISGGDQTHRERDALYGLVIGGAAGAVVGGLSYKPPAANSCFFICETRGGDAVAGGVLGGILGTFAGGFIVGSLDKTERWVPLRKAAHVFLAPGSGGLRVGLSSSF